MFLIPHRSNLHVIQKKRGSDPSYIKDVLNKDYDVEVDFRFKNNKFFLEIKKLRYIMLIKCGVLVNQKILKIFFKILDEV